MRMWHNNRQRGFTLIEVAICVVLLGIGILALLVATGSSTAVNGAGKDLSQAVFLAQEFREYCFNREIDTISSARHEPPINGLGNALSGYDGWAQNIRAWYMNPDDLSMIGTDDPSQPNYIDESDIKYIECDIERNGQRVFSTGWFVVRK